MIFRKRKFHLLVRSTQNELHLSTWLNFRAKKKIVLDLRRTKSTENMQTNEKSEVTDDLDPKTDLGSQMDLSEKPIEEKEEEVEKEIKPEEPPETKVCVVCSLSCVLILKAFSVVTFKATCKVIFYCHQTLFNL